MGKGKIDLDVLSERPESDVAGAFLSLPYLYYHDND
jgi:hypothetical protein